MKRLAAALLVGAALLAGCKTPDQPTPPAPSTSHQPEEDEPGWNCHTMGNHECGPEDPRA